MFRETFAIKISQASDKSHRNIIISIQKNLGPQAIDDYLSYQLSNLDDLIY